MVPSLFTLLLLIGTILQHANAIDEKEIFVFTPAVDNSVWSKFDWEAISSIVWFDNEQNYELADHAWKHGVRVIKLSADIKPEQLTDAAERSRWVKNEVDSVVNGSFNGTNIDFEYEILANNKEQQQGLVKLCQELYTSLKAVRPDAQMTFDVAWSPDCIDNRCFDVLAMMPYLDFIFVMSYDERSQIRYGPCAAGPNAGFYQTVSGLNEYLAVGINASQIVLGVPWYGRDYPCVDFNRDTNLCLMEEEPFRGVNCSDSPGTEKGYGELMNLARAHNSTIQWDELSKSPYFAYQNISDGSWHQVWFDNSQSLGFKYDLVRQYGLRGAGMWNTNCLDNSDTAEAAKMREEFWSQLRHLKSGAGQTDSTSTTGTPGTSSTTGTTYKLGLYVTLFLCFVPRLVMSSALLHG